MQNPANKFYEFGYFRLDVGERLLLRGDQVVPLSPKAFEMLLALVGNCGHVLTKEELMKRVWPDTFVEEGNLSHNIYKLREALGESRNGEKYIETVPRRGYRFVAPVSHGPDDEIELVMEEHTRARVVIEEDTSEMPVTSAAGVTEVSRAEPKRLPRTLVGSQTAKAIVFSVGLVALLAGGLLWQRQRGTLNASPGGSLPAAHAVPLTSFADIELCSALSPDGNLVAFSWQDSVKGHGINLYVQQIDASTPLQLTTGEDNVGAATWSPDGRFIAFSRNSADPERSGIYLVPALGGHERRLLATERTAGLDWSPDGKYIAFNWTRNAAKDPARIHLLDVDSLQVTLLTEPPPGVQGDVAPAFSPDNQTVAFIRKRDDTADLFAMRISGGQPQQLTFDSAYQDGVAWTSDGKELVFSSNRGGSYNLWRIPSSGGEPKRVEGAGSDAHDTSIARFANRLSYSQQTIDTNIWRVPLSSATPQASPTKVVASSRRDENGRFSPDGKKIAFESKRTGNMEIWVCDSDGSNQVQLTNFHGPATGNPRWSPDGKEIAFDSRPEGHTDIFVISSEGGPVRRVTSGPADNVAPSWSHDGSWLYFGSNRSGSWQIWRTPIAGGNAVQLTEEGGYEAAEAPDGQTIYYNKYGYYTLGLFQRAISGGAEIKVLDLPQLESFGDWWVTPEGIYFVYRYDSEAKPASPCSINFFNFATHRTRVVVRLPHDPTSNPGLNLSPDGQWLLYSIDDYRASDIMMVENFR